LIHTFVLNQKAPKRHSTVASSEVCIGVLIHQRQQHCVCLSNYSVAYISDQPGPCESTVRARIESPIESNVGLSFHVTVLELT